MVILMIFGHFQLTQMNGHGYRESMKKIRKENMEQKVFHRKIIILDQEEMVFHLLMRQIVFYTFLVDMDLILMERVSLFNFFLFFF